MRMQWQLAAALAAVLAAGTGSMAAAAPSAGALRHENVAATGVDNVHYHYRYGHRHWGYRHGYYPYYWAPPAAYYRPYPYYYAPYPYYYPGLSYYYVP